MMSGASYDPTKEFLEHLFPDRIDHPIHVISNGRTVLPMDCCILPLVYAAFPGTVEFAVEIKPEVIGLA